MLFDIYSNNPVRTTICCKGGPKKKLLWEIQSKLIRKFNST